MANDQVRHSGESQLTRAERDVLTVLLTGAHSRQIAEQLFVTEATVRTHLTHIYSKLDVDGRAALIATFRDALPARSPNPAPVSPRHGMHVWLAFGVAATVIVGIVAAVTFTQVRQRVPSPAPVLALGARVAAGPDAGSAPPIRGVDRPAASLGPAAAGPASLASPPTSMVGPAAVLIALGGCAIVLAMWVSRFGPRLPGRLRPRRMTRREGPLTHARARDRSARLGAGQGGVRQFQRKS